MRRRKSVVSDDGFGGRGTTVADMGVMLAAGNDDRRRTD
jgi:hypothetical protein